MHISPTTMFGHSTTSLHFLLYCLHLKPILYKTATDLLSTGIQIASCHCECQQYMLSEANKLLLIVNNNEVLHWTNEYRDLCGGCLFDSRHSVCNLEWCFWLIVWRDSDAWSAAAVGTNSWRTWLEVFLMLRSIILSGSSLAVTLTPDPKTQLPSLPDSHTGSE